MGRPTTGVHGTIETYRQLCSIEEFGLAILPVLVGDGVQSTPSAHAEKRLGSKGQRAPERAVELVYATP